MSPSFPSIAVVKTVLLVFAGMAAGLAIAFWPQPSSEPSVDPAPSIRAASVARSDVPRAGENASNRLDPAPFEFIDRSRRAAAATPERLEIDLIVAGFAPDRARWINRRVQELRMHAMQTQSAARREGRPPPADVEAATLRAELGDQDYERFLAARGVPTGVNVVRVLARSPAERAGMQRGDEIFSYDGKRVFNIQELNELALRGTRGESVVLDVRRNGQNLRIVLPRGPIGVRGGNDLRGAPPSFER